jgi:predicted SnoaL-like aldol condensation-catalyzing enzyme
VCTISTEENRRLATLPLEVFTVKTVTEFEKLADELYAPDYKLHDPGMPDFGTGPEAVKRFMHTVVENTPDVHIVVQDVLADGDMVATRFTVYGTNASTGKPEVTEVMSFCRMAGGKFVEEWQLGVQVPAPVEVLKIIPSHK